MPFAGYRKPEQSPKSCWFLIGRGAGVVQPEESRPLADCTQPLENKRQVENKKAGRKKGRRKDGAMFTEMQRARRLSGSGTHAAALCHALCSLQT